MLQPTWVQLLQQAERRTASVMLGKRIEVGLRFKHLQKQTSLNLICMAKNKTTATEVSVTDFINTFVDNEQKKKDSLRLVELMREWSGCEAYMWGPTIIGFGSYHYKYASGHEGDAPLIGFSPRKAEFSLYVYSPGEGNEHLLDDLGKFKMGKACIYVKKLSDINIDALEKLCKTSIDFLHKHHQCGCSVK
jgi:hypothetical protein